MENTKLKSKINKIIKNVENESVDPTKEIIYLQQIKVLSNDVHYLGVPKKNVLRPAGLKKGDWVQVTIKKIKINEAKKNE